MIGSVTYIVDSGWMPPVDYVLEVYGDTSPAELFDGTVWMPLRDCIIVAAGDIFTAGATGGNATVTLTTTNLPNHTHGGACGSAGNHSHTADVSNVKSRYPGASKQNSEYGSYKAGWMSETTSSAGAHTHTVTVGSTGSGSSWSIMGPYYAVNIWQRVG